MSRRRHDPRLARNDPTAVRIDPQERRVAVALKYRSETQRSPTVVASGRDAIARRIIECARENDVPVRTDGDLATLLSSLELGAEIPEELYKAVAEILAFIYRMNDAQRKETGEDEAAPARPRAPSRACADETK